MLRPFLIRVEKRETATMRNRKRKVAQKFSVGDTVVSFSHVPCPLGVNQCITTFLHRAHTHPGYKKRRSSIFEQPKSLTEVTHILMNTLCSPTDGWWVLWMAVCSVTLLSPPILLCHMTSIFLPTWPQWELFSVWVTNEYFPHCTFTDC